MEKRWEYYENLDEVVYVSDMDTYDLIYMNRKAREIKGLHSMEEVKNKKCYELLQGNTSPCHYCNNDKLRFGYFEEWDYFNPVLRQRFMLKDTMVEEDGRRCRFEVAIAYKGGANETEDSISNEIIINQGLRISFSGLSMEDSISALLEYIGKTFRSERAYIFEADAAGRHYSNTYEWCAKGVTAEKDNLQKVERKALIHWLDRFEKNENVIIRDIEKIKGNDPAMYDILEPQNIHSLVVSPLLYENKIIGFYGVDNPPAMLLNNISNLFQILGYFIALQLKRYELFKRLENLSLCDQLTGLRNRHALDLYVEELNPEDSIGVVYADVSGLKKVNDTQGHKKGDELLKRAAKCIKDVFFSDAMFRIGGDEFLVLCSRVSEAQLLEKMALLRMTTRANEVLLAAGCVWRPDSRESLDRLLKEADSKMYEDKKSHYSEERK
jgi:diguanylate cyclase (GGDEF)-like protein